MAIGPLCLHRGANIGINGSGFVASTPRSGVEKYATLPLFLSLKSLNQLYDAIAQKWASEVDPTVHFPIWHQEIEDIIVLKNNKGTEDNRVRKLDYSIQLSKIFYERFINDGEITLFSPHDVPGLYDFFWY